MKARQHIAGRAREVAAMLRTCPDPPEFILDSWAELVPQVNQALEADEPWRAIRLADDWADLAAEAIVARTLNAPHDLQELMEAA